MRSEKAQIPRYVHNSINTWPTHIINKNIATCYKHRTLSRGQKCNVSYSSLLTHVQTYTEKMFSIEEAETAESGDRLQEYGETQQITMPNKKSQDKSPERAKRLTRI